MKRTAFHHRPKIGDARPADRPAFRSDSNAKQKVRRPELKLTAPRDARAFIHASIVLQQLQEEAPRDYVTLGWLTGRLHRRSFGMIMLVLALVATVPGVSIVAGLLLMIPAFQMIAGKPAPIFPRRLAARPLPTRHLAALMQRAIPVLRYLERIIRPRWSVPLEGTKRFVGIIVVTLNTVLVLAPIPLTNVVPALVIALISLAYLEEDGLVLSIALLVAVIVMTVAVAVVWETVLAGKWLSGLW